MSTAILCVVVCDFNIMSKAGICGTCLGCHEPTFGGFCSSLEKCKPTWLGPEELRQVLSSITHTHTHTHTNTYTEHPSYSHTTHPIHQSAAGSLNYKPTSCTLAGECTLLSLLSRIARSHCNLCSCHPSCPLLQTPTHAASGVINGCASSAPVTWWKLLRSAVPPQRKPSKSATHMPKF